MSIVMKTDKGSFMAIEKLYKDTKYCIEEIHRIREMWSNRKTATLENMNAARESLSWMYLYCNEDIKQHVESALNELDIREFYCLLGATNEPNNNE